MKDTLTLGELSKHIGVEVSDLQRMVRVGSLPEASKQVRADGPDWVVPVEAIPELAARHGWTIDRIDLTAEPAPVVHLAEHKTAPPLTPVRKAKPAPGAEVESRPPVTVAEVIDNELLGRLLGAHEEKANAVARVKETERALESLSASYKLLARELAEERSERFRVAERLREERYTRRLADAKLAELRAWIDREVATGEAEKRARQEAVERLLKAERDAAVAIGAMGWMSRRRFDRNERADRR